VGALGAENGAVEGMVESMDAYGSEVTRRWYEVLASQDFSDPARKNSLSELVNRVYLEVVRDFQSTQSNNLGGIADFYETFSIDAMLLQGVS
jgi:hypothetical protein